MEGWNENANKINTENGIKDAGVHVGLIIHVGLIKAHIGVNQLPNVGRTALATNIEH